LTTLTFAFLTDFFRQDDINGTSRLLINNAYSRISKIKFHVHIVEATAF